MINDESCLELILIPYNYASFSMLILRDWQQGIVFRRALSKDVYVVLRTGSVRAKTHRTRHSLGCSLRVRARARQIGKTRETGGSFSSSSVV